MKLPDFEDFDSNRKLFFDSLTGAKTFQLFADKEELKGRKDLRKVITFPKDIYPDSEVFKQELHDRTSWMPMDYIRGLEHYNDLGCGVYMTVNETDRKGRREGNIIRVRSFFADFDETPLPESFIIEPSMIVETSPKKYHVYFFTEDAPLEGFKQLQKAIAYNLKTDPVVHDLPRVVRVPGFYHNKANPFLSRIINHTGLKYSFKVLSEVFPPEPVKKWSAPKYDTAVVDPDKEFKGGYGASKGGRNCHVATRVGGMLKRGLSWNQIEVEVYKEAQACIPPLNESETQSILKSMRRYA